MHNDMLSVGAQACRWQQLRRGFVAKRIEFQVIGYFLREVTD